MDRRQRRTRTAIFKSFSALLSEKPYAKITIQDIIDLANIGRSTFYAHFQTKECLLEEMCGELFDHIIEGVMNDDLPSDSDAHETINGHDPVFCHLLHHIAANTNHTRDLLTSDSSDIFLRFFKQSLDKAAGNVVDKEAFRNLSAKLVVFQQVGFDQFIKALLEEAEEDIRAVGGQQVADRFRKASLSTTFPAALSKWFSGGSETA